MDQAHAARRDLAAYARDVAARDAALKRQIRDLLDERDDRIRAAHRARVATVRELAAMFGLSKSRVGQIVR